MNTNEIAKILGRHKQTIAKYEKMFKLKILKDEKGHKVFSLKDLEKLQQIKQILMDKDPRINK